MPLKSDIESALNRASRENESDTPDWLLAEFLMGALALYEATVTKRDIKGGVDRSMPSNPAPLDPGP